MGTSLLHPGCWGGTTSPQKCFSLPQTGMPPALGRKNLLGTHPAVPLLREQPVEGKPSNSHVYCRSRSWESQAVGALGSGFSTGQEKSCTSHPQKVIWNLVRKNWEGQEAPTSQHITLPCSNWSKIPQILKKLGLREKTQLKYLHQRRLNFKAVKAEVAN